MSLQIPARRSRRIQDRDETVEQPEQHIETTFPTIPTKQKPLQTLVLNKRRRIGNRERDLELEAAFAALSEEKPLDELEFDNEFIKKKEKKPVEPPNLDYLDEQTLLEEEVENDEKESESDNEQFSLEEGAKHAREFLEEDLSAKVIKAITDLDESARKTNAYTYKRFFKKKCTLPDPLLLEDGLSGADTEKENYIFDLSTTYEGRKFLLSSGALLHWHRKNWPCPHAVYQWLFQIVAFERDKFVSRHAYTTLKSLWTNIGAERVPYQKPTLGRRNLSRYIDIASFRHVLTSYGAVKSELDDSSTEDAVTQMSEDWSDNVTGEQHIPLEQFSSVLRLFGFSIRSWPEAYTLNDIKYIIRILLQIRLDRVGDFIARDIENAIESTISALNEETWEAELRELAANITNRFSTPLLQAQITKTMKPTYERCAYLKRMVALSSLNFALEIALSKVKPEISEKQPQQPEQQSNTQSEQQSIISSSASSSNIITASRVIRAPGDSPSSSSNYTTPDTSPARGDSITDFKSVEESQNNVLNGSMDMDMDTVNINNKDGMILSREASFLSDAMSLEEEYGSVASRLELTPLNGNNDTGDNNKRGFLSSASASVSSPSSALSKTTTNPVEQQQQQQTTMNTPAPTPTPPPPIYAQTPSDKNVLGQILKIIQNRHSIFKTRNTDLSYNDVLNQATLLAEAIGANEAEMSKEKFIIGKIITELQQLNRRIGGGLGSYERSKANEAVQRLWTRLAYMKGRDETMGYEDHVA
ncbi:hypothetical protein BDC45DRAFT_38265 [Circinella umbellata]|nr:hypothetical protein BDC45DRAFT_38265 [Circinella umbellata]